MCISIKRDNKYQQQRRRTAVSLVVDERPMICVCLCLCVLIWFDLFVEDIRAEVTRRLISVHAISITLRDELAREGSACNQQHTDIFFTLASTYNSQRVYAYQALIFDKEYGGVALFPKCGRPL